MKALLETGPGTWDGAMRGTACRKQEEKHVCNREWCFLGKGGGKARKTEIERFCEAVFCVICCCGLNCAPSPFIC